MKRKLQSTLILALLLLSRRAGAHGFNLSVNYNSNSVPVSISAFSQSPYLDQQQATAAPDNLFLSAFSSASSDQNGTYFPVIHGFAETSGPWLPYTATYSIVSPLYFSGGSVATSAPQGTYVDVFNLWAGNPEPGISPHPGAAFGDSFVTGQGWSYSPADQAPFGVSLYDSHELEKDLYIGSGPTYGEYGFAFTVTAHFNDGVTLTTGPLVDIFAMSDPNYGDFADTASVTQQDQATFAIYRAIMRGDFNLDAQKTAADIPIMLSALCNIPAYKSTYNLPDLEFLAIGDVNQDGAVTNADLQALLDLLANRDGTASTVAVPEPSSICLILIGGLIWSLIEARSSKSKFASNASLQS